LLKAFVINLDRSGDRLAHMRAEFGGAGLHFERIAAVDGAALSAKTLEDFRQARPAARWLPGEIGCFLSHFEAWRRIALGEEAWAAVFEDDIRVSPELGLLFDATGWIPGDADVVRLEANRSMRLSGGRAIATVPGRRLYVARSGTAGAAGYILGRRAAARLIEAPTESHMAADLFLFKPRFSAMARALRRYQVVPALCVQESILAGSNDHLKSLIKHRNTRGRGYHARPHPFLRLWPIQRFAVPFQQ
jgi:glycosyl transferase family 25